MDPNKDNMIDLTNALYSKLTEANELAKQLEEAADGTAEVQRVRSLAVDVNNLQGRVSVLGHDLRN